MVLPSKDLMDVFGSEKLFHWIRKNTIIFGGISDLAGFVINFARLQGFIGLVGTRGLRRMLCWINSINAKKKMSILVWRMKFSKVKTITKINKIK